MKLLSNLRRAWRRHDEKLAETASRDEARVEHVDGPDERLETIDGVGKAYGEPRASDTSAPPS
jgi:hypothetical protein